MKPTRSQPARARGLIGLATVLIAAVATIGTATGQVEDLVHHNPHEWPMFKCRPNRNGRTPRKGPQTAHIAWQNPRITVNGSSPVISRDGTIYIGGWDGSLYAVDGEGLIKWSYPLGGVITASPALGRDGTIYIAPENGDLHAFEPDGTLKWTFDLEGYAGANASPVVTSDGTIYVATDYFYALNPDGTLRWRYDGGYSAAGPASLGHDDTVYFPARGGNLFAITPTGELKWSVHLTDAAGAPTIAGDGTIYINDYQGRLRALRPDGTLKWLYKTEGIVVDVPSSPAIGASGTIYFGGGGEWEGRGGYFYAVHPDGTLKWKFFSGCDQTSPAVGSDETIFFGNNCGGTMWALDAHGAVKWSHKWPSKYLRTAPSIGFGDRVYVGLLPNLSGKGALVAFGP